MDSNKPLKILQIILKIRESSAPYNEYTLDIADQHIISICTYFSSSLKPPNTIRLFEGDNSLLGFLRTLKTAIEYDSHDLIHCHSPHGGFAFVFIKTFSFWSNVRSSVYTVHSVYKNYKLYHKLMMIPVFAFFGSIVCCSQTSYSSLPWLYRYIARSRLHIIQNGVDLSRIDCVVKKNIPAEEHTIFTIVSVGRLISLKNPVGLLNAVYRTNEDEYTLRYLGDGDLRKELTEKADRLGVSLDITGFVSRAEVYKYLIFSDLFVSTSFIEGLPVSVLEAMACRCPVILSNIPAHREIAKGRNFIPLIRPGDTQGFAKEILYFKQMDTDKRKAIGEKCRQLVIDNFDLLLARRSYEKIYRAL